MGIFGIHRDSSGIELGVLRIRWDALGFGEIYWDFIGCYSVRIQSGFGQDSVGWGLVIIWSGGIWLGFGRIHHELPAILIQPHLPMSL